MSHLSDRDIREAMAAGEIVVDPLGPGAVQPASVDVRLGAQLLRIERPVNGIIDPTDPNTLVTTAIEMSDDQPYYDMMPDEMVLGATHERIEVADTLLARLEGKSSLARCGLAVHITAGIVDPGWIGRLTFEFVNMTRFPIRLHYGRYCAQLTFDQLVSAADLPYGHPALNSKYQGDSGPAPSQYYRNDRPERLTAGAGR